MNLYHNRFLLEGVSDERHMECNKLRKLFRKKTTSIKCYLAHYHRELIAACLRATDVYLLYQEERAK